MRNRGKERRTPLENGPIMRVPKMRFVAVREEFLAICDKSLPAAILLALMEGWTVSKSAHSKQIAVENSIREHDASLEPLEDSPWIYNSYKGWANDSFGLLKEYEVEKGLELLLNKGFIVKRHNPRYRWDRTLQYQLNAAAVNRVIIKTYPSAFDGLQVSDGSPTGEPAIPENHTENQTELKEEIPELTTNSKRPEEIAIERMKAENGQDLAEFLLKGRAKQQSWTVPEASRAETPANIELAVMLATRLGLTLKDRQKKQWAREFAGIINDWGATPEQAKNALEVFMSDESEVNWKPYSSPFQQSFHNDYGLFLGRAVSGKTDYRKVGKKADVDTTVYIDRKE